MDFDEAPAWDGNAPSTHIVFDEAGSLDGAIDNPFRIELSAGAETLGIHLRWLPGAKVEFPYRERTLEVEFGAGAWHPMGDVVRPGRGEWVSSPMRAAANSAL